MAVALTCRQRASRPSVQACSLSLNPQRSRRGRWPGLKSDHQAPALQGPNKASQSHAGRRPASRIPPRHIETEQAKHVAFSAARFVRERLACMPVEAELGLLHACPPGELPVGLPAGTTAPGNVEAGSQLARDSLRIALKGIDRPELKFITQGVGRPLVALLLWLALWCHIRLWRRGGCHIGRGGCRCHIGRCRCHIGRSHIGWRGGLWCAAKRDV